MMKRVLCVLTCLLFAAAVLAGCSGGTPSSSEAAQPASTASEAAASVASSAPESTAEAGGEFSTTLEDIKAKGKLVIGLDDTFAPMGFRDTDGTLVGFDIDLATAVCAYLEVEPEFQPIDWNAKEMELNTGNIDCIWNGMSITPEREESMSLSQAYLNNKIIVMTNVGVTIADKADLVNYNIGTQGGSAALEALQSDPDYETFKDQIVEYPTYDEVILDMDTGRLDCMVIDEVFGNYKNAQIDNKFGTADFDFGDDLYAVGFRKGDTELTQAVNDALNALIEDGTAAEISTTWFGTDIVIKP